MKFGLVAFAALALSFGAKAQDINEAIELFNKANQNFTGKQYDQALADANKAYQMVTAIGNAEGEEVATLKTNCEKLMQVIPYLQAKDLAVQKKYDEALAKIAEAKTATEKYNDAEVVKEVKELYPQLYSAKAVELLTANNFQPAIDAYKQVIALDPGNVDAYVRMGYAYDKLSDEENAISNYEKGLDAAVAANDEADANTAKGQLAVIYLKKAQADLQAKKFATANSFAKKSNEYNESANAYYFAGTSAMQLKKNDEAIASFEKAQALGLSNPQMDQTISYYLGTMYEAKGNKAKACANFKKAAANAQFKAYAESKVKTLCN